ncbi:hypothetical protein VM1G_11418 [Cytospora mali]|uniref:F-box domain-containing protein n=1 Tax=Cytospora mali TaxID=578113 RepID=A0A194VPG6_CYTMA|nr:hypothetical protein VM1G_11418 [Valsa mali]
MEGKKKARLLAVPLELLIYIWSHLPNHDIKSLRLACSYFHETASLRLERILLSDNSRNIDVFCALATHEVYRRQIKELIYDDARLGDYKYVTDILAKVPEHGISRFIIDTNQLLIGINSTIFEKPCAEYNNLATLLRQPGFERIDLALAVGGQEHTGWASLRGGWSRRALAGATDLKHLDRHFVPLRMVFPVDRWSHLSHFGLGHFIVKLPDLTSVLGALPGLRSIELVGLLFSEGHHMALLE